MLIREGPCDDLSEFPERTAPHQRMGEILGTGGQHLACITDNIGEEPAPLMRREQVQHADRV